jgi:hypothetical protein
MGHVRVCVRMRPMQPHEMAAGDSIVLRPGGDGVTLHAVTAKSGDKETLRQFTFDRVCGSGTTQAEFFDASGIGGLLDNALAGVNATIFAYGA